MTLNTLVPADRAYMQAQLAVTPDEISGKSLLAGSSPRATSWYARAKYGFMTHYAFGGAVLSETIYPNGTRPGDVNALANAFDATKTATFLRDAGFEYFVFTAFHGGIYGLWPSAVLNSYLTGHSSTRDVIADLIVAMKAICPNVKLILYVHPIEAKDLSTADQAALGWTDATGHYAAYNTFINALFAEIGNRYGTDVAGFWTDECNNATWATYFTLAQTAALRQSLLAGNPNRVLIGNLGANDGPPVDASLAIVDVGHKEYNPVASAAVDFIGSKNPSLILATTNGAFWANTPTGTNVAKFTAADFFRILAVQSGVNDSQGGGLLINAGIYASPTASVLEDGVEAAMVGLAALVNTVSESIKGAIPSASYITPTGQTITALPTPGYVATTAADYAYEYIHVLKPPAGALSLPAASDKATFDSGINLATGRAVTLSGGTAGGYTITLHPSDTWSTVDTVIKLVRRRGSAEKIFLDAAQFTGIGPAAFQAQGTGGRFPAWRFVTNTTGQQIQAAFTVPEHWRSFDVDLWVVPSAGNGGASVNLLTTTSEIVAGELVTANDQQLSSGDMTYAPAYSANLSAMIKLGRGVRNRPTSIRHIRIQRGGDGGANLDLFGVTLTRVS